MFTIKVIDSFNGTITPSDNQIIDAGSNITFTFEPNPGYIISDVYVDNINVGCVESYSFVNIQNNHSIYVQYMDITMFENIAYNKLQPVRGFGYKIIEQLMKDNDDIWKLLKYNTTDALKHDFLTIEEKKSLIYKGIGDSTDFRIFKGAFVDDSFDDQVSQLRVYLAAVEPVNRSVSTVNYALEPIVHTKLLDLDNFEDRLEVMVQQIISTLNGKEIRGITKFSFDRSESYYNSAKLNIYNNRNFFGFTIIMSCKMSDMDTPFNGDEDE